MYLLKSCEDMSRKEGLSQKINLWDLTSRFSILFNFDPIFEETLRIVNIGYMAPSIRDAPSSTASGPRPKAKTKLREGRG